jgi:hypothetical protein
MGKIEYVSVYLCVTLYTAGIYILKSEYISKLIFKSKYTLQFMYLYIHICICLYACICINIYVYVFTNIFVFIYSHMYQYKFVCIYYICRLLPYRYIKMRYYFEANVLECKKCKYRVQSVKIRNLCTKWFRFCHSRFTVLFYVNIHIIVSFTSHSRIFLL